MNIKIIKESNPEKIKAFVFNLRKYEKNFDNDLIVSKGSIEKMLKWMERVLNKKNSFLFVAKDKVNLVGYIFGWIEKRSKNYWKTNKYGYICDLFVKEEFRNRGIGKLLLRKAEDWFKDKGISKIFLDVYFDNPAKEFYRRQGYYIIDSKMVKDI
jgi:ribosomal protein S18 acetylase RimI-like enzyme